MIRSWTGLAPQDRDAFRTVVSFLNKRLAEQETVEWALKLKPEQQIERLAIEYLLTGPGARNLPEPWASAWRLIEESWASNGSDRRDGTTIYYIQQRLRSGDRSGAAVKAITNLVAPRLEVEPIGEWRWTFIKKPRKPKTVEHILFTSLTSGDLIDLHVLELANLDDVDFLTALANALEAAVDHGLDTARRIGWDGGRRLWRLGDLSRVYYSAGAPRAREAGDPDAYHHGIAPSVKLLHAVVARILELDVETARRFVQRWRLNSSPVHLRLWAAMSRNEQASSAQAVFTFLTTLDQDQFWDLQSFPEIAEMRAVRFGDMNEEDQTLIIARIQRGPPRNHWPKRVSAADARDARLFWSLRELRRIEVGGGVLPERAKSWFESRSAQFAELSEVTINEGFSEGIRATRGEIGSDGKYENLSGVERLKALETALGTARGGWDDDPAERANAWIIQRGNADRVLADFETTNDGGDQFPRVWNRFGRAHRQRDNDRNARDEAQLAKQTGRVLGLLTQLSDSTLSSAIEGICAWLDAWEEFAVKDPLILPIWFRLWPIAVAATERSPEEDVEEEMTVITNVRDDDNDRHGNAALNTPAGKLTGVFFAAWRGHVGSKKPFRRGSELRQMRDKLIATDGRSGLLVRYRMIEYLPYFLHTDSVWSREHLVAPLHRNDDTALALWRAVARRTHFNEVLKTIGEPMVERANDRRLGRETRRRLVFSLVIEALYAFLEHREPAVPNQRITQMLRTLDDEVRASAASAVRQFVQDISLKEVPKGRKGKAKRKYSEAAAAVFRSSAAHFLRDVWPQERSLATPGVSGALADLPAASGEAFGEAVDVIARFLVPFDCWSMLDYGLYGDDGGERNLAIVNDDAKARALLTLLDLTIGSSEGAVIPHDLTDALDQIASVDSSLAKTPVFRRLATAARR